MSTTHNSSGKASMEAVVGRNIRRLRLIRSRTLEEVSVACGLSKSQMSKIENGHISPPLSTVERIAKALEVDAGSLLRRTEARGWHVGRRSELEDRRKRLPVAEHHYEVLFAGSSIDSPYQPMQCRLSKPADLKIYRHAGAVLVMILTGSVVYEFDGERVELDPGDIFFCDGRKGHGPTEIVEGPVDYLLILGSLRA